MELKKEEYKGPEFYICNVCGAKYRGMPKIKCEEFFCRRCDSRLSPYLEILEKIKEVS